MTKRISFIIMSCFLLLLLGYSNHYDKENTVVNLSKQKSSNDIETIPFEYFFRGFVSLKENQVNAYPKDTLVIETDEDWQDFMEKFVPGIPYYLSVNYTKECLVFSVTFPSRPSFSDAVDIKSIIIDGDKLEPKYVENDKLGIANGIYAQNTDDIEHCFVNIVKISKKYLSKDVHNIYHKNDLSK